MKTIAISAVNLVEAGTLAILRDCLAYLSELAKEGEYRVVAVVHKKEFADFPNIDYIETQWPKKKWTNRLWFEYVSLKKISKDIGPVYLWLSLHDTSPSVIAERRAVYCHNSFSFYKWKLKDLLFAPKIATFAIFTKYIYRTNINKNDYLIVQQEWFRKAMSDLFNIDKKQIIVARPNLPKPVIPDNLVANASNYSFVFAGSPNSHKNFECICQAAEILEKNWGIEFNVYLTVKGDENKYAKWLFDKWGKKYSSLHFIGFISKETLNEYYEKSDCLIFPSKIESWGLPISEFKAFNKPMLLADLPYARETAAGAEHVAFFNPEKPSELAVYMKELISGKDNFLQKVEELQNNEPMADDWHDLFQVLLKDGIAEDKHNLMNKHQYRYENTSSW